MNDAPFRHRPLVVGIGGAARSGSSAETALGLSLAAAEAGGAQTVLFGAAFLLRLPHYAPDAPQRTAEQLELVRTVAAADGLIIATPAYHGGISGLVKNALDTLEDLSADTRPYLDGRAVGCIVTLYGWQAAGTVLASLRAVVHALRGWPTPLGAAINTLETSLGGNGRAPHQKAAEQLAALGQQVSGFALRFNVPHGAALERVDAA